MRPGSDCLPAALPYPCIVDFCSLKFSSIPSYHFNEVLSIEIPFYVVNKLVTCHFIVMRHHNLDQFLHFILISRGKKYTFILSSNNFVYYLCLYVVRMFAAQRYMKKY